MLDGGFVQSVGLTNAMGSSSIEIASTAGSTGTIWVSGAGSQLLSSDDFFVVAPGNYDDQGTPGDPSDDYGTQGQTGLGTLTIDNGGQVTVKNFATSLEVDGVAVITVDGGGSSLTATDGMNLGGQGSGSLAITNGGVVTTTDLHVDAGGSVSGDGTFVGGLNINGGGSVAAGTSVGSLTVAGNFNLFDGAIQVESGAGGVTDLISASNDANLNSGLIEFSFLDAFLPTNGNSFEFVTDSNGVFFDAAQVSHAISGIDTGTAFDFNIATAGNGLSATAVGNAAAGNDLFYFGSGRDDTFSGDPGNDVFDGGSGNDQFTGDSGDDLFVFGDGDNALTITDFSAGAATDDVIDLTDIVGFSTFGAVQTAADDNGGLDPDTVITLNGGDTVTLLGVNVANLAADDFLLS